ncbi:ATP-binding protein [Streptomyces sp. NPDC002888]|uniref:ATP-binding protein n=1 Tax=Streptomyces sp. NPDC002888 TaxID=3364668 RepID=UPI0036A0AA84
MSHLRAPAARADRREGGRHGRPVPRAVPPLAETHIRPQLLRLAVLPPIAVALSACAAVLFTVRSTGARPSLTLWGVLAGAIAVTGAGIVIAAVAANRAARCVSDRIGALRESSARGEADLRALVEALRRGEGAPQRKPRGGAPEDADEFELLAADLSRAHDGAVTAVVQAAQLSSQTGSEQKLEVFVNLARRLQSLVHREISILDELENEIEDPDLLKGLFHVDHLATRIRRHAENLAVLGGAVSRRQWSNPVSMTEVLRSAIAEVEQYSRVKLVPPIDGELGGHAVADVIHLLAELIENATVFSAPHTQVLLRANLVTSGLAVEVEDRGLGMPVEEQSRMNALLADPDQVNVARLLADGRIGLFVVSQLARRHGIRVRLQTNIYGGVQAVLVVPQAVLGTAPGASATAGTGATVPAGTETTAAAGPGAPGSTAAPVSQGSAPGVSGAATSGLSGAVASAARGTATPGTSESATPGSAGRTAPGSPLTATPGAPGATSRGSLAAGAASEGRGITAPVIPGAAAPDALGAATQVGRGTVPRSPALADADSSLVPPSRQRPHSASAFDTAQPTAPPVALPRPNEHPRPTPPPANPAPDGSRPAPAAADADRPMPPGPERGWPTPAASDGTRPVPPAAFGSYLAPFTSDGSLPVPFPREGSRPVPPAADGSYLAPFTPDASHPAPPAPDASHPAPPTPDPSRTAPAPLPRRGGRGQRANPAEAVPGIRAADRHIVAQNAGAMPTPRVGTVRGTMGKPQLPRRRAQEHIAPQLRGGPAPRQDAERQPVGHDPGLMAAFQRGIGLAEAQQSLESDGTHTDPAPPNAPAAAPRTVPPPRSLPPLEVRRPDASRITGARPGRPPAPPETHEARDGLAAPGPDHHTTRHDGSAPAG